MWTSLYRRSLRAGYTNICQQGHGRADPAWGHIMEYVTFSGPFPPSEVVSGAGRGEGRCGINLFCALL